MRFAPSLAGAAALAACAVLASAPLAAQSAKSQSKDKDKEKDADRGSDTRTFSALRSLERLNGEASDRPVIGISTTSSGERDTLGLLVVSVAPGGPADRAGIEEGDRLAAVNGVNLRLAAADAGENDMNGLTTRRLTREIAKAKPGSDVELRVWSGGAYKNVKVKTVAADELPGRTMTVARNAADRRTAAESRGVLGLTLGGGGSRRDTLGMLVGRVETDGPAEKAGIVEGDRIASVNGTNLRVSRDDAGDGWVVNAKNSRFTRVLRELKPGEKVTLGVYSGGQTKTVTVTAAKASDVYKNEGGTRIYFGGGEGFSMPMIAPMPPMAPMAPRPAMPPMPRGGLFRTDVDGDGSFEFQFDPEAVRGMGDAIRVQVQRAMERATDEAARAADEVGRVRITAPRVTVVRRGTTTI
jgi:hypothetical protein